MLDVLFDNAESLIHRSATVATENKDTDAALNIGAEPNEVGVRVDMDEESIAVGKLLQHFRVVQSLFLNFNSLLGPLLFVMIVTSAVILIDSINNLINPRDESANFQWVHWVYMAQRCIYLTVLEEGHSSKILVHTSY